MIAATLFAATVSDSQIESWVAFLVRKVPLQKGKSAINLSNFGEFVPNLSPGYLFMLGRSAASKIIYVRPVGIPENTSNIGGKS